MKETIRKTICLLTAAAALIAGCVLLGSVLKSYSHTVPVVIGPQRQAALTLLFTLLMLAFGAGKAMAQTYNGGTWYSLYDAAERTNNRIR